MHMSATNICVWFRVIVVETLNSIAEANHFIAKAEQTNVINGISPHSDPHPNEEHNNSETMQHVPKQSGMRHTIHGEFAKLPELSCYWSDSIGKILMAASPYLYPFCVEYSLICAVASVRMRTLKFKSLLKDRLEEILILISVTGLYMFRCFNLIAGLLIITIPLKEFDNCDKHNDDDGSHYADDIHVCNNAHVCKSSISRNGNSRDENS
ncbi:hypothetical protein KUTeg_000405 [Tegillarca granosa]|uniref:Uncharacterized protein n=1 Tax=Tegillarca granosa TaxID=220873 RepID=A0ABQ9FXH8_TEGGR|nr:hypothetical protein KUTeg_000405 [Tegillarca granosa]